jgi:hypothetical protein
MDACEAAWNVAQIRRAEWAVIDTAIHLLPPSSRTPLQKMHARLTRERDAAIAAYRDAMDERDGAGETADVDPYDDCDFCGATTVKAVLVDAGPEFGLTVSGCMICPACVSSERTGKMERDEMARDYEDEIGGAR